MMPEQTPERSASPSRHRRVLGRRSAHRDRGLGRRSAQRDRGLGRRSAQRDRGLGRRSAQREGGSSRPLIHQPSLRCRAKVVPPSAAREGGPATSPLSYGWQAIHRSLSVAPGTLPVGRLKVFIFATYSGYIVSAPPRRGSSGVPNRSVRFGSMPGNGLLPGRKCGTVPRVSAVSVASSHGYGLITIDGSLIHIIELRMYGSVKLIGS